MASTLVLGSTGMTGSHILSTLLGLSPSQVSSTTTVSRRSPNTATTEGSSSAPRLNAHVDEDSTKWEELVSKSSSQIMFSALATTKGAAGTFEKQYAMEHDLNIQLAKAARSRTDSPTSTYVLISGSGASSSSSFPYVRMKGDIERDILALDFDHTVILRPGLIGGRREELRPAEAALRWFADAAGAVSGGMLKDFWTQDADVIARAAVRAGLKAQKGELPGKSTILYGKDIMQLGKHPLTENEKKGA